MDEAKVREQLKRTAAKTTIYVIPEAQIKRFRKVNQNNGKIYGTQYNFKKTNGKTVALPAIRIVGKNVYIVKRESFGTWKNISLSKNDCKMILANISFTEKNGVTKCRIHEEGPVDETIRAHADANIVKRKQDNDIVNTAKICAVTAKTYEAIENYLPNSLYSYSKRNIPLKGIRKSKELIDGYYIEDKNLLIINVVELLRRNCSFYQGAFTISTGFYGNGLTVNYKSDPIKELTLTRKYKYQEEIIATVRTKAILRPRVEQSEIVRNNKGEANKAKEQKSQKQEAKGIWHSKVNLSDIPANKKIVLYSKMCHCSKCSKKFSQDTIVDCTALVTTKKGNIIPVTAQYCSGCSTFFMNYEVFESYNRKYGGLKFNCELDRSFIGRGAIIGFADDSFLSRAGYSVKASVSQRKRQVILAELLDSGQATKWEITEKISEFIKLRRGNPDMANAIACWEEDIAFVADYDAEKQKKVGRATFKQGGKITRR